jgi:hypothetical protein
LILLIEPFSNNIDMFIPAYPLPLLEIASFVKAHRPAIDIEIRSLAMDYGLPISKTGKAFVYRQLALDIARLRPTGVGISCTAIAQAAETIELCEQIKAWRPEAYTFIGGYFPSIYHEELLAQSRAIDLVVIGEGEVPALEIIDCLERGEDPKKNDIAGLAWRDEGQIHMTAPWKRFSMQKKAPLDLGLLASPEAFQILPYSFSRGCPYRCSFCMEDVLRPQRKTVPREIVRQDLVNMGNWSTASTILVSDALFKSFDFFPLLRKLHRQVNFETRCDNLDPALLDRFADVCGIFALGLESASYHSLRRMNKVKDRTHYETYLAQAEAIFKRAVKNEIPIMIFMIAGYPGDREQDLEASLAFVRKLARFKGNGGFIFKIGETRVYPKTKIYEWAMAQPDVVVEDQGVFGDSVVRRPSKALHFDTVETYMQEIFSLSHSTPKLVQQLGQMMPFFRIPFQALQDNIIPDSCFLDQDREVLNAQGTSLAAFHKCLPALAKKYQDARAGQRSTRTLPLGEADR